MNLSDKEIVEACERHKYDSFWEVFDYMKIAAYEEVDAMMTASAMFYGDIWGRVINASKVNKKLGEAVFATGGTYNITGDWLNRARNVNYQVMGVDPYETEDDDLMIEVFLITDKGNAVHMPIYRAYLETRKYKVVPELEEHIKSIQIQLTTELSIKLFNEGYAKFK